MMMQPVSVHVDRELAATRLLAVLGRLTGVSIGRSARSEACVRIGAAAPAADAVATLRCPGAIEHREDAPLDRVEVRFVDDAELPWPFRGRTVATGMPTGCRPLRPDDGESVLAASADGPLWVMRTDAAGRRLFRSAMPLLEIPAGGAFAQVFAGATFLANLPLLHLLTQLGTTGLGSAALRANFMFDDPNLHWSTYGHVDFAHLLQQAAREQFHVSFATIPLDAWYANARVAALFRDNAERLSLLVHGNNHTRHELAREPSPAGCAALLRQALQRIGTLERRAGVHVDRVMVPPHGACSETMLAALPAAGFDGACLSSGSLAAHNPQADWIARLGFLPAEPVAGCPVMPRWALSTATRAELLVAAYLGRPLILRGHHGDLRDGVEALVDRARFINGLGDVAWIGNAAMLQASCRLDLRGADAVLHVFSRHVAVVLPPGLDTLEIRCPDPSAAGDLFTVAGLSELRRTCRAGRPVPLARTAGPVPITVSRPPAASTAPVETRGLDLPAALRRILTEARDRLMPLGRRNESPAP